MCLRVTKLVKTKFNIVPCYKKLYKQDDNFITPYRGIYIPKDGWLIPNEYGEVPKINDYIYGGFIHAFEKTQGLGKKVLYGICCKDYDYKYYYQSFAINVKAYGEDNDLISRLLFVPNLYVRNRHEIVKFLQSKPNKTQFVTRFPQLEKCL